MSTIDRNGAVVVVDRECYDANVQEVELQIRNLIGRVEEMTHPSKSSPPSKPLSHTDVDDEDRVPERAEVRSILEEYFVGPINDADVDRLHGEVAALVVDDDRWGAESASFRANSPRYRGHAWLEVLARGHSLPTSLDLVAWLALTRKGYPAPKPWCPQALVGAWTQLDPLGGTWHLRADGTFTSSEERLATYSRWAVRGRGRPTHAGDEIMVSTGRAAGRTRTLHVWELESNELTVDLIGGAFPHVRFKLRRG